MDYEKQAYILCRHYIDNVEGIVFQRLDVICKDCGLAADSIITLLARAEAAEARVHDLETTHRVEMCEDGYDCVELGKVRKKLEVAEARAEKAEKCMAEIEEAMKFQRYSATMLRISEYLCEKEG